MKTLGSLMIPLAFAFVLGLSAGKAGAEGFIFVTIGGAITEDSDYSLERGFGGSTIFVSLQKFAGSASIEVGGGAWYSLAEFLDLGYQGGLGYYGPTLNENDNDGPINFHLIPLTASFMARVPLFRSEQLPHGRIQPFGAIGPSFLISTIAADQDTDFDGFTSVGFHVGFDARAGINVNLTNSLALFLQYRRTEVDVTLKDGSIDLKIDFVTHHISTGFGLHF